jgi:hypothetical protein
MNKAEAITKILSWLKEEPALLEEAQDRARGDEFEYNDNELFEWVYGVLYTEEYGELVLGALGVDLRHLNQIREIVPEPVLGHFTGEDIAALRTLIFQN